MNEDEVLSVMRKSICINVSFEPLGVEEYLVHTGYTFSDGDELHIILRRDQDGWLFSDEGHTQMWLSYTDFEFTPTRQRFFDRAIAQNHLVNDSGCLSIHFDETAAGPALTSMIQAILSIADILYLERHQVNSTFKEDIEKALRESSVASHCIFGKKIELPDDSGFESDAYVEGSTPIVIFSITGPARCNEALVNILLITRYKLKMICLAVVDGKADITVSQRGRLDNLADSTCDLSGMIEKITRFGQFISN